MKRIYVFLLGILAGVVLMLVVAFFIGLVSQGNGVTLFDKPGRIMSLQSVRVFQTLENGAALADAYERDENGSHSLVVLIIDEEGSPFYDDQQVSLSRGEVFRQIGLYRYSTRAGGDKTVPIVSVYSR